jgi:rod shape-determining protein MreC
MNPRRRARIVLAVLVLASLVLITADFRSEGGPLAGAREAATSVFAPLQGAAAAVTSPIVDGVTWVGDLWDVRAENARLRDEVERLRERRLASQAVERENAELRALLGLRDASDWETVAASTVAFTPSNFEWTITIDVGSDDGVQPDMPVVEGAGLVGRVLQVTPTSSRVLLAIDPNFSAAIRGADSGEAGVVTGQGSQLMRLSPDGRGDDFVQGTEVVTNNYAYGVFPAGIPVGVVDQVDEGADDLSRTLLVRPFVDFERLGHVLVVLQSPTVPPPQVPNVPDDRLDPPQLVPDEPSAEEGQDAEGAATDDESAVDA